MIGERCSNCNHEVTKRNQRYFTTFREKPLCKSWKACYERSTGRRWRSNHPIFRKRGMMSPAVAIRLQNRAIADYKRREELRASG